MKIRSLRNNIYILVVIAIFLFQTINIYADECKGVGCYISYTEAEGKCFSKKNEDVCTDNNCIWTEHKDGTGECHAIKCNSDSVSSCQSLKYCDFDKSKTSPVCYYREKMDCQYYSNCLSTDNNGHICDTSKCNSYSVIDDINKSYVPSDSTKYCRMLYDSKNVKASRNTATRELCDSIAASSYKGNFDYQACLAGELTLGDIYNSLCVDPNGNKCSSDQYSYYLNVGGQFGGYHCGCLYGSKANGTCNSHGGGGTSKCPENYDFVKNGYNIACSSDSCVKADCDLSANPFAMDYNKYYNPKLSIFDGETKKRDYDKAYMYTGTCNGKDTDVYCIDPSAAYHDNGAGYVCNAALNEEGETDEGFIKIYQLAIDKYQDDMSIIASPLSNATTEKMKNEYAGIHMALRYWTFYSGFGINEDRREHNQNIAKAFSGTSQAIMNREVPAIRDYKNWTFRTLYNGSYFVAKGALNETQGYKDAVEFFTKAASDKNIWKNPLEFELISRSADKKTATIRLSNIQELKDTRYTNWNFVKNITCTDNCTIIGGINSNIDYLRAGYEYVDFTVSINNIGKSFTVMTNYYDRRDAKNIIIATSTKNKLNYQRLLFIASEPRDFKYDKTFNPNDNTCFIGGGVYYGKDGKALGSGVDARDRYLAQCCNSTTSSYRSQFCSFSYNKNISICKDINEWNNWINNGCPAACNPTNTTDKCAPTDYGTKDIIISDLTDKNGSLYTNDGSTDKYCYACAYGGDLTGNKNAYLASGANKYCAVYCVKDYKFNVPTNLGVYGDLKYGRYLSVSVGASGTQTCFTGEINTTLFNQEYNAAKQAAKAAIDEYARWKNVNVDTLTYTSSDSSCSKAGSYTCGDGGGDYYNCGYDSVNNWCNCMSHKTGKPVYRVSAVQTQAGCSSNYKVWHTSVNGVNFSSGDQSCDNSNCNSHDGSVDNVKNQVRATIEAKYQDMINKVNALNDIISTYNSCSSIDQGFDFNPKIEFSYEEKPYNSMLAGNSYLVGNSYETGSSIHYYQNIGSCGFTNETNGPCVKHNQLTYTCNNGDCSQSTVDIYCNNYVKKSVSKAATLTPNTYWCTKAGNGSAVIKTGGSCGSNYYDIGNVYPLTRNCGKDKNDYNYGMKLTNLGNVEKVLSTVSSSSLNTNLKYACDYHVNNKSCEGCEALYYYRSVSLNDLFTKVNQFNYIGSKYGVGTGDIKASNNNKHLATNYRIISDYTWSSPKGQYTKKMIEDNGENAYKSENLQYSYTLTPAGMKQIRAYNDKNEVIDAGGYGDFDLLCGGNLGNQYFCKSSFLDMIKENKFAGVKENARKGFSSDDLYQGTPWK